MRAAPSLVRGACPWSVQCPRFLSVCRKDPEVNKGAKSGRRGARPARREERAYRAYVSDEQRSPAGCIGGQTGTFICFQVLSS